MDNFYIAILSFAFIFLLHHLLGRKPNKAPLPSPPAIPFAGHIHLVKKPFHAVLARLAERHGPLFSLRLGTFNAVVVSSPALAKECFTEMDVTFANRPRLPSWKFLSEDYSMIATSSYNPHWRNLRRVAAVQLLSTHRVSCMSGVISGEVHAMVRRLNRSATESPRIRLKQRLFELSLSVLMETIANTKATRSEATAADTDMSVEAQEFRTVMDNINPLVGLANLWELLPIVRWFDVSGIKNKLLASVTRRDAFLQRLIDAERRNVEDGGSEDGKKSMISVMFGLQKKEPNVYTDKMIRGLITSLFSAGTDTILATTEWAMSLLLNHPTALKKAHAQIDQVVGTSRLVSSEDLSRLTYLHCIISETLRLYPAAPLLLPHQTYVDCKIGGHTIPSGTMLICNAYAIHRDPNVWEDPLEFKPDRFEDGKAEGLFMIPFGMGRRKCPGEAMALRTMGLVLGALIQCFEWDRVDDAKVDMKEYGEEFVVFRAIPFEALCKPRASMYDVLERL
uniref:CYP81A20-4 n=1 Tax=Festuca rubra subsp. commutata TaxID=859837 RepID=G8E2H8_FESRU|nr:CYP81A20-4 [Festuca rubra subsp. commutata]